MKSNAAVVIIGGGIQGTSIAYHLAQRGVRDIVLIEADLVGSGSSGRSAAMLMLQMSREMTIRLSQESFKEDHRKIWRGRAGKICRAVRGVGEAGID